jgi:hypothetical protein
MESCLEEPQSSGNYIYRIGREVVLAGNAAEGTMVFVSSPDRLFAHRYDSYVNK